MKGREVWIVVSDDVLEVFETRAEARAYCKPWWDEFGEDSPAAPDYFARKIGEPWVEGDRLR